MADTVKGTVVDDTGEPLIGATVQLKGTPGVATATDIDGNYTIKLPDTQKNVLVFSYIGMDPKEVQVNSQTTINVTLSTNTTQLDEVVVVGYGQQKKASIVGAITQASGEVLERAGGVSSVGAALTGNLPGVITTASSGMPGEEDPEIIIRSQSSWNNSAPLILVDGIEREMSSVDISSVANISVLKDASATAVYGVKGANSQSTLGKRSHSSALRGLRYFSIMLIGSMSAHASLPGTMSSRCMARLRIMYES